MGSTERLKTVEGSPQKFVAATPPEIPKLESSDPEGVNRTRAKLLDPVPSPAATMYCCEFSGCSASEYKRDKELMVAWPPDPKLVSIEPFVFIRSTTPTTVLPLIRVPPITILPSV